VGGEDAIMHDQLDAGLSAEHGKRRCIIER
jgi:hypothetical protein